MPSIAQLQVKYPHFDSVIHKKLNLREKWHFCNIVTKGNTSIQIAIHADLQRQDNSHGSHIIDEIANRFDFIVREVLRCPVIHQVQRNVYIDKQKQELIEQMDSYSKQNHMNDLSKFILCIMLWSKFVDMVFVTTSRFSKKAAGNYKHPDKTLAQVTRYTHYP